MKYKIYYKGSPMTEYNSLTECVDCITRMITILNNGVTIDDFKIYRCDEEILELIKLYD